MSTEREELRRLIQELPEEEVPAISALCGLASTPQGAGRGRQPDSAPPMARPLTQRPSSRSYFKTASVKADHQRKVCRSCHQARQADDDHGSDPWPGPGMARPRPGGDPAGAAGHSTGARR
jgi:hypothetical protein